MLQVSGGGEIVVSLRSGVDTTRASMEQGKDVRKESTTRFKLKSNSRNGLED